MPVSERNLAERRFSALAAAVREHEASVRRRRVSAIAPAGPGLYRRLRQICGDAARRQRLAAVAVARELELLRQRRARRRGRDRRGPRRSRRRCARPRARRRPRSARPRRRSGALERPVEPGVHARPASGSGGAPRPRSRTAARGRRRRARRRPAARPARGRPRRAGCPWGQVFASPIAASIRSSRTGDIACSSRSASSWTSSHGMPRTSVRKRSIRRWRRTIAWACSRPSAVKASDLSLARST